MKHKTSDVINNCEFSIMNIFKELYNLNSNSSIGLDGLLPIFLKEYAFILSFHIIGGFAEREA